MRGTREHLDTVDRQLLDLLADDARKSVADLAKTVGVAPATVGRRMRQLEKNVIVKYTIIVDHEKVGPSVEAYVELDFDGKTDVPGFLAEAVKRPEVREASTLAGRPDAILRVRAENPKHIQDLVSELRATDGVIDSKTLMAFARLRHAVRARSTSGSDNSAGGSDRS